MADDALSRASDVVRTHREDHEELNENVQRLLIWQAKVEGALGLLQIILGTSILGLLLSAIGVYLALVGHRA